jgi:hypothetical protein
VEQELLDRVARAAGRESKEELMRVRKEIVDLHGEMVLLENYSALNYTGESFRRTPPSLRARQHGTKCCFHVVLMVNYACFCCWLSL